MILYETICYGSFMSEIAAAPNIESAPQAEADRSRWIALVVLCAGMLMVILFTGRAEPPARSAAVPASAPPQPNTDRVRDYQDRLRILESRAAQEA